MLEFMDLVQQAFYRATNWNIENSYGQLTVTSQALLNYDIPRGVRLSLSSLASPNFATSYAVGSTGPVDGALSYLYTSAGLLLDTRSATLSLPDVIRGYRQIQELRAPEEPWMWESWHGGKRIDTRDTLLFGRMYLPTGTLEALYLRRITPTQQLKLSAVSNARLRNGGTILALHQYDVGKYSTESLYSTDGGLLGVRGLYNFGPDPRKTLESALPDHAVQPQPRIEDRLYGRFSAGAELYYGALNKSGGMSIGGRFATLPAHKGIPLTATLTLNPLMGNLSATYAVKAGRNMALCSRMDFNVYSYESDLTMGMELWRMRRKPSTSPARSWENKISWSDEKPPVTDEVSGVLKARIDQNLKLGVLWEGRVKELLFTLGSSIDMRRRDQPFRAVGLELQYSS